MEFDLHLSQEYLERISYGGIMIHMGIPFFTSLRTDVNRPA